MIKQASYQAYQRYLCKDCDRMFNLKTGIGLRAREDQPRQALVRILHAASLQHEYLPVNAGLDVSYRSLRRCVELFARTLDAPAITLVGPVEKSTRAT